MPSEEGGTRLEPLTPATNVHGDHLQRRKDIDIDAAATTAMNISSEVASIGEADGGGGSSKKDEKAKKEKPKLSLRVFRYGTAMDWTLIGAAIIFSVASGVLMPIFMGIFGDFMDSVSGTGGHSFQYYINWQLALGGTSFVVSWIGASCMELAAERQVRRFKTNFLHAVTRQEMAWFDTYDPGELASKMNDAIKNMRDAIGLKFAQTFLFSGIFVGGYVVGFIRDWRMSLVISATLPLLAVSGWFMMRQMADAGTGSRAAYAAAGATAEEAFGSIRSVAAFNLEEKVLAEYVTHLDKSFKQGVRSSLSLGMGLGTTMCVFFLSYALGFWYGGKIVADSLEDPTCWDPMNLPSHCTTGGTVLSVFFCIVMAAFSIGQAGPNIGGLANASAAVQDIAKLIDRKSLIDPEDPSGYVGTARINGDVKLRNVSFAYPARPDRKIFSGNLSVHIPVGKSVALVGASGCGKSTIIQLIQRFYDPVGGSVEIDGRDLREYNLKWIRRNMALVSQEPRLFATTIYENIRAGREDASEDEIIQAAKDANAHDFICQFPKGYQTYVGEGGNQLSGGQKQRVAIARAILRNPAILILDEATSALDNESERIVQATLDRIVQTQQRTTVIIAHRLSTVRRADKIVVLSNEGDGARVIEEGTHDELIAKAGAYAILVKAQAGSDADDERHAQVAELAENFQGDIPTKQLSAIRLRSKFSRVSRRSSRASSVGLNDTKERWWRRDPTRVRWHTVLGELRPYWYWVILALLGAIASGCAFPVFSIMFSRMLGAYYQPVADDVRHDASFWSCMFLILAGSILISTFAQQFGFGWAGNQVVRLLRERTCQAYLYQDMEFFDDPENTTGMLSETLSADILSIKGWIGDNTGIYFQNIAGLVSALIISFTASAKLAGVCLGACMLLGPAVLLEAQMMRGAEASTYQSGDKGKAKREMEARKKGLTAAQVLEQEQKIAESNAGFVINETIMNIRTIAAYSLETTYGQKYAKIVDADYKKGRIHALISGFAWGLSQFAQFGVQALCLWYGGKLITQGEIDIQRMMQAIFALFMAAMGAGQTMIFLVDNSVAQNAANKVYGVINRQPKIDARSLVGKPFSGLENSLKFDNVNFRYPQRPDVPIYHDLSFELKKGEVVALVGPSGCGKSTAVQLVERFYDVSDEVPVMIGSRATRPSQGAVYIDGTDLREFNVQSLRAGLGLVNQEPVLFSSSIAENIACGKAGGASIDQVIDAAKKSNAYKFVMDFPDGFETSVGKLGGQLSGGQKQRIAIARAIIRNPAILILDEATSALDAESEKIVQHALDQLLAEHKRSTIVIAHRLSTVRNADRIVVLNNDDKTGSKVVESGTHGALMEIPNGVYRGLVEIAEGRA